MTATLDHFIYAGRDLDAMRAQFEQLTGVSPARGGRHPGLGTHNALASLGTDVYFELLAVDPTQSDKLEGTMGGRLAALPSPRLFAYMLKGRDLSRQQTVLAERYGARVDHVAFAQSLRILMVVLLVLLVVLHPAPGDAPSGRLWLSPCPPSGESPPSPQHAP